MLTIFKESIRNQFGASIDMLENAIVQCPSAYWESEQYWYKVYHCLFFLDYYLTMKPHFFSPPPPYTLSEFEDTLPNRVYSKAEMLIYLEASRIKCYRTISNLTEENIGNRWINESGTMNYSIPEILLYNMRHVQHHAAQLNLILRQKTRHAPEWVERTATS